MRLVIVADYFNSSGGAGVVCHAELKLLSKDDHRIIVISKDESFLGAFWGNIRLIVCAILGWNLIVHTWSFFPVVALIKRFGYSKITFVIHDYLLVCPNKAKYNFLSEEICQITGGSLRCGQTNCGYSKWKKMYHFAMIGMLGSDMRNVKLRFLSDVSLDIFRRNSNLLGHFNVLPNIDCTVKGANEMELGKSCISQYDLGSRKYLLYVGRNTRDKGFDRFENLETSFLKVACGPKKISSKDSLALGWRDQMEVYELINNAIAVVYPSRQPDCDPLVLQYCLKLGVPMYVTDNNASADRVRRFFGENYIVKSWEDFSIVSEERFERVELEATSFNAVEKFYFG